ncbi:hypothetical protein IMZ48_07700, partial [Candidatus Bathyarchaeota archaeon]|nr:hypothetical protein [Candidatus Bathyarchaeota archaeon]
FYADPAVSLFIAVMIFVSAVPLVKSSGLILLQSAPLGVDLEDIRHDLETVSSPGMVSFLSLLPSRTPAPSPFSQVSRKQSPG